MRDRTACESDQASSGWPASAVAALRCDRCKTDVRRSRKTRYRHARFADRRRPAGWLAPSLRHRVVTTEPWVRRYCAPAPITALSLESVRFDLQKMENPEIPSGVPGGDADGANAVLRELFDREMGPGSGRGDGAQNQGRYVGRVALRASHWFNIQTSAGVVQGISHRHCKVLSAATVTVILL